MSKSNRHLNTLILKLVEEDIQGIKECVGEITACKEDCYAIESFKNVLKAIVYLDEKNELLEKEAKKTNKYNNSEISDCKIKKSLYFQFLVNLDMKISLEKISETKTMFEKFNREYRKTYVSKLTKYKYKMEEIPLEEQLNNQNELGREMKKQREAKVEFLDVKIKAYCGSKAMSKEEAKRVDHAIFKYNGEYYGINKKYTKPEKQYNDISKLSKVA